jgi:MFS family permease
MSSAGVDSAEAARERNPRRWSRDHPGYKWVALSNTTVGMLLATINSSIVLISLPAIFRGIGLNPLAPGNISYLLWMIMGFLLVSAALVVTLGRMGDMYGRVRIYSMGFVVFAVSSIALALVPFGGGGGALWLIGWRVVQGVGGAMLFANSTAILTDAFPAHQRGMALGTNQVAAIGGSFIGLVLGGVLAEWHWRSVFWVSVPIAVIGAIWSYRSLHEMGTKKSGKIDWWGNVTFALGLTLLLAGMVYGINPYGGHPTGWTNPWVLGAVGGGLLVLIAFCVIETRVAEPMFHIQLFRGRLFALGSLAGWMTSIGRGGLQFMLIIWLQGIWLPLHGYSFESTPLWAGIYLLPLTVGFLVAGPVCGVLSDRYGARLFATAGLLIVAASMVGLMIIPVNFPYWLFAALLVLNGIGSGMFSAPNTSAVMSAVPAGQRGAASGMRATFLNSGSALSIGIFFTFMIVGLAGSLPGALRSGLGSQGVPAAVADQVAALPPVGSLFAAFLGFNPIQQLLAPSGVLHQLPAANVATLTGKEFFPRLISGPFQHGLFAAFLAALVMTLIGAVASALQGREREVELPETLAAAPGPDALPVPTPTGPEHHDHHELSAPTDGPGTAPLTEPLAGAAPALLGGPLPHRSPAPADPAGTGFDPAAVTGPIRSAAADRVEPSGGTAAEPSTSREREPAPARDLRDRLLAVLLEDPEAVLAAAGRLESSQAELNELRRALADRHVLVERDSATLRKAGLTAEQVSALLDGGDGSTGGSAPAADPGAPRPDAARRAVSDQPGGSVEEAQASQPQRYPRRTPVGGPRSGGHWN